MLLRVPTPRAARGRRTPYAYLRFLPASHTILRMTAFDSSIFICDGCGQPASPEHTTRRLQRLEWMTRFRPVHIGTVLLGAASPELDSDFLYSDTAEITGEAAAVLAAAGIFAVGKTKQAVLVEFQRGGFLLGYVAECPLELPSRDGAARGALLQARLPLFLARLRRSFGPKRVACISGALGPLFASLTATDLGCVLLSEAGQPFSLDGASPSQASERLHDALFSEKTKA